MATLILTLSGAAVLLLGLGLLMYSWFHKQKAIAILGGAVAMTALLGTLAILLIIDAGARAEHDEIWVQHVTEKKAMFARRLPRPVFRTETLEENAWLRFEDVVDFARPQTPRARPAPGLQPPKERQVNFRDFGALTEARKEEALKDYAPVLARLKEGLHCTYLQLDDFLYNLLEFQSIKAISDLKSAQAVQFERAGRHEEALVEFMESLAFSQDLQRTGDALGAALGDRGFRDTGRALARFLVRRRADPNLLSTAVAYLERLDSFPPSSSDYWRIELLLIEDTIQFAYANLSWFPSPQRTFHLGDDLSDQIYVRNDLCVEWSSFRKNFTALAEFYERPSTPGVMDIRAKMDGMISRGGLGSLILGDSSRSLPYQSPVWIAILKLTAACLLSETETGRLPRSLDELIPRYIVQVPLDPYGNGSESMGYVTHTVDKQSLPVPYSRGPNLNDGGAKIPYPGVDRVGDLFIRYEDDKEEEEEE